MTKHNTGTREQWRAARLELLKAEKELHTSAAVRCWQNVARVAMGPSSKRIMCSDTDEGSASLAEPLQRPLTARTSIILVFGPDYKGGCPSCSSIADGFDGMAAAHFRQITM